MTLLLVVCGVAIGVVAGWLIGRGGRADRGAAGSEPAPGPTPPDPMYVDVLEKLPIGVIAAAPTGEIEYRNDVARAFAGTHVGVLIDEVVARHLRSAAEGTAHSETIELFGPPKRVVVVSSRRLASGSAVAFVDDITDQRRADQMRTDFVANVSHELRTPLGALMVLAEALVDTDDPDIVRRVVDRMLGEADRATRTIDDLLELSHIESGVESEHESVRVVDVVRDAVRRVSELATTKGITISMLDPVDGTGPRSEGLVVLGNRRHLASAVGNVVENAVKYSDSGAKVTIRVHRDDMWVEIVVNDDGPGIPQRDLDRIFERFYRVDRARSRSTGGTGLGLSIVRHVTYNHGGTVTVDSTEGEGTTFVFRLPLATADAANGETSTGSASVGGEHSNDQGVA